MQVMMPSSPSMTRKLLLSRHQCASNSRRSLFAFCCFLFGMVAFGLSIYIIWGPISTYRCNKVETLSSLNAETIGRHPVRYRPKALGLVGIQTGFESAGRRKALRETWVPSDFDGLLRWPVWCTLSLLCLQKCKKCISLEQATGLAFRFVIGRVNDARKMGELKKEEEKYGDFMRIDIEEEYHKLPYKTLAFFKAAFNLFDADFYVKVDDDIYLRPDRLATLLAKERSSPRTYIGCMKKGPVFRDPNLKWYEPLGYLLGKEYFIHAYGPIYALSVEVVAGLAALRNDSFRMFSNEDVTIGAWMLAMNVNHEDNRALCSPECTSTSIAVWDIPSCSGLCNPAAKLKQLHDVDLCSKSPTLAPD